MATASACARGNGDRRGFRVDRARRPGTRRGRERRRALARRASRDLTTPARGARRVPSRRATPRATRVHAPNVSAPPKSSSRFQRPSRPSRRDASRADGECPTRRFAGRKPPRRYDSALRRETRARGGRFYFEMDTRRGTPGPRDAVTSIARCPFARAMVGTSLSNHRAETDPLHGRPRRLMRFIRVRTRHPSIYYRYSASTPSGPARGRPRP
jgi:hypothetical protein